MSAPAQRDGVKGAQVLDDASSHLIIRFAVKGDTVADADDAALLSR